MNSEIDYTKLPPECDELCRWRPCLHKGENKGAFTPGRGYTRYYDKPEYVCMTRMLHGCYAGEKIGRGRRPDFKAMLDDLEQEINSAKATQKVKRAWKRHLRIMRLIINEYVMVENEDQEG